MNVQLFGFLRSIENKKMCLQNSSGLSVSWSWSEQAELAHFRYFYHTGTGFSLIFCLLQTFADLYTLRRFYRIQTVPKNVIQCKKLELTGKGRGGVRFLSFKTTHLFATVYICIYVLHTDIRQNTCQLCMHYWFHPRSVITVNLTWFCYLKFELVNCFLST